VESIKIGAIMKTIKKRSLFAEIKQSIEEFRDFEAKKITLRKYEIKPGKRGTNHAHGQTN